MSPRDLDKQLLGGRRSTGIAALGFVAVLVVAMVTLWNRGDDPTPNPNVVTTPNTVTTSSATTDPSGGISSTTPASLSAASGSKSQVVPTAAPTDVTWQLWNTVALPFSPTAGPTKINGQAASGFAHTPTGALIAAVQASIRAIAALDPGWKQVVTTMTAPGVGQGARIKSRSTKVITSAPEPGQLAQIAGFQFVSYASGDAIIQIVGKNSTGTLSVFNIHMTWLDGDWKLVLTTDGGDSTNMQQIPSLAGFIAWSGV